MKVVLTKVGSNIMFTIEGMEKMLPRMKITKSCCQNAFAIEDVEQGRRELGLATRHV